MSGMEPPQQVPVPENGGVQGFEMDNKEPVSVNFLSYLKHDLMNGFPKKKNLMAFAIQRRPHLPSLIQSTHNCKSLQFKLFDDPILTPESLPAEFCSVI